jgi:hypothetical protein
MSHGRNDPNEDIRAGMSVLFFLFLIFAAGIWVGQSIANNNDNEATSIFVGVANERIPEPNYEVLNDKGIECEISKPFSDALYVEIRCSDATVHNIFQLMDDGEVKEGKVILSSTWEVPFSSDQIRNCHPFDRYYVFTYLHDTSQSLVLKGERTISCG